MVALGCTGIGALIALYFIFCGFCAWIDKRHQPDYVPFRMRWDFLIYFCASFGLLAYLMPNPGQGVAATVLSACSLGLMIWMGLTILRFAFHLVDVRHG